MYVQEKLKCVRDFAKGPQNTYKSPYIVYCISLAAMAGYELQRPGKGEHKGR